MVRIIDRLLELLKSVVRVLLSILLLASVLVIFTQVFCRYILGFSLVWSEEFARYASIWITFLGLGLVGFKREHIRLDFFEYFLPEKARYALFLFESAVSLVFYCILGYFGFKLLSVAQRQIAPGLKVSMVFPYLAIPVGCFIFVILVIWLIVRPLINHLEKENIPS